MSSTPSRADALSWQQLLDAASAPYRAAGRFAWHFARGKLGHDPVFRHLLQQGLVRPNDRVLDIGCGQGLLASLLLAAGERASSWPAGWREAPRGVTLTGIELMPKDVDRANAALGAANHRVRFVCADMRDAAFPACDAVVILDVLHYIPIEAQDALLRRVHAALSASGRLLLRIGDSESRRGFAVSQWVDRVVTRIRGHRVPPTFGRPLAAWVAELQRIGFDVEARPMSQGTPFANVLLVANRRESKR